MIKINPCPRCNGDIRIGDIDADRKNPPKVVLYCHTEGCLWNMTCHWDDLSGKPEHGRDYLLSLMIEQWNEGTKKKTDD